MIRKVKVEGQMEDKDLARSMLDGSAAELFDDIVTSRVLGASRHTKMIGDMILSIVNDDRADSAELIERVGAVADYFKETRGKNSRAIYTAINMMVSGLDGMHALSPDEIRGRLKKQIGDFTVSSGENTEKTIAWAVELCRPLHTVMVFDYSSTVDSFVRKLDHRMTVYIPESRALNGGQPFVKGALAGEHEVRFIPDTAMMQALTDCDAAFMGAETLYPDGSVFNTIGSDILGVLCKECGVPLYVLSPLIKVDARPVYGYSRLAPMPFDYGQRLAAGWEDDLRDRVDFKGIKLVKIDPKYITAIISEAGIVPSGAFYSVAMQYDHNINGGETRL